MEVILDKSQRNDERLDLLFAIIWMTFPDSLRQKGTGSFGEESSGLETLFGLHASKNLNLDLFSFGARVQRSH